MPVVTGVVVAAITAEFAMNRDFGVFLICVFVYVPALGVVGFGFVVWGCTEKCRGRKMSIFSSVVAMAVIGPASYAFAATFRDQIAFAFWSSVHVELIASYDKRDGIVSTWDGWGIAGMENDSDLIADHGPPLLSIGAATSYIRSRGGRCEIVGLERIRPSLYIVTTYNCSLAD